MQNLTSELLIYTDGSSRGNPGPGGYGAILVYTALNEVIELGGSHPKTTNNIMELSAIISALAYSVSNTAETHIYTDSKYVIQGITNWIDGWRLNGWKTKGGDPVKNQAEWKQLWQLVSEREGNTKIYWHHIPGHAGFPGNERADIIATEMADGKKIELYRGNTVGYFIANIEKRSVVDQQIKDAQNNDFEHTKSAGKKAFSYLSLLDDKLMRHQTWDECKARVAGKKAKYRKALSADHEKEIIKEWGIGE